MVGANIGEGPSGQRPTLDSVLTPGGKSHILHLDTGPLHESKAKRVSVNLPWDPLRAASNGIEARSIRRLHDENGPPTFLKIIATEMVNSRTGMKLVGQKGPARQGEIDDVYGKLSRTGVTKELLVPDRWDIGDVPTDPSEVVTKAGIAKVRIAVHFSVPGEDRELDLIAQNKPLPRNGKRIGVSEWARTRRHRRHMLEVINFRVCRLR